MGIAKINIHLICWVSEGELKDIYLQNHCFKVFFMKCELLYKDLSEEKLKQQNAVYKYSLLLLIKLAANDQIAWNLIGLADRACWT